MSPIDCRDAIKKRMKGYLSKNTTAVDFFASLDKEVAFNVLERLLKTSVDLFQCKIAVFHKELNEISLVVSRHLQNHPCIYLENGMISIAFLTVFERTK